MHLFLLNTSTIVPASLFNLINTTSTTTTTTTTTTTVNRSNTNKNTTNNSNNNNNNTSTTIVDKELVKYAVDCTQYQPHTIPNYIDSKLESKDILKQNSVPSHMAVILSEDTIIDDNNNSNHNNNNNKTQTELFNRCSLKLCDIILWSIFSKISRLTIFDPTGLLKKNIDTLQTIIDEKMCYDTLYGGSKNNIIHIDWLNNNNNNNNNSNIDKLINLNNIGGIKHYFIKIGIVSVEDGKLNLVDITKKFARESKLNNSTKALDDNYIQSNLPRYMGGEDYEPQVAIDFSNQNIFSGFLPWHIKLTEFMQYGMIEKRCGK
ncbi:hypothetical protein DFA_11636 [Cavenderia fasciculata]|uniref:ditrans,polycis-polyprenyl diphosphate synthase [(2E,6E)-farnesyldiphosphate specific] n=1 Tax=Cavenderia fasciculata TaxID=261658 RepID=F4QDS8_CACFS|nr:uncharacterized protein DFA_11636 [Cavenderia fasciculata]EGG13875.1 hypothetical protein DFA_11636 [Cavenderia fasciculata]|eukprot:XP_004350583.1 hypothetical protein DFA_11636 [Cavenderia fasciculata]